MSYFYVTFDMTPLDERGDPYIQTAIAPINPINAVGSCVFNSSAPCYSESETSNDISRDDTSGRVIPVPGPTDTPVDPNTPVEPVTPPTPAPTPKPTNPFIPATQDSWF